MSFTPAFRPVSDAQMGMMGATPFYISRTTNVNTLASLQSRDMVRLKYTKKGVLVSATKQGFQIYHSIKLCKQTDYFATRAEVQADLFHEVPK